MQFWIQRLGTIDSTSERAFADIAAGTARDGHVFVAEAQTAGRGRLGRRWHSAPGEGLYVSVVLMPREVLSPAGLTIAVGLATLDAVHRVGLVAARLKWPNDVVVRDEKRGVDAKLAGILVETRGLDVAAPHYVAGVGVNVTQRAFLPELQAERAVTSLALAGVATSVSIVLDALLASLPNRVAAIRDDPSSLERDFTLALGLAGERVRVVASDEAIIGNLTRIDIARGVVVACDDGTERRVALEIVREISAS